MRQYEVMVVLAPNLEEEEINAKLERLTGIVSREGGEVTASDKWGKRRLAYEIEGFREGYYHLMKVTCEPSTADELDRVIKITDGIIRHLIVREDEK